MLEAYGYSLSDDLAGKFEFAYKEGKPFLRVLDPSIKRVTPVAAPARPVLLPIKEKKKKKEVLAKQEEPKQTAYSHRLGIVFNFNKKTILHVQ